MEILLKYLLPNFILVSSMIFIWHQLLNKKINFKNPRLYISVFSIMLISLINYFTVDKYIKIIIIIIVFMFFFRYLFKDNIQKCIITPIFYQLIIMFSEMIFVVLVCVILDVGNDMIVDSHFGGILSNISIATISILIFQIPLIRKTYILLLKITNKIRKVQLMTISILLISVAYILSVSLYFKIEFRYLLMLNTGVAIFCTTIVMYTFKTKNNYIKINEKYNTTLKSLKEYEEILDKYRISNHENKNELLTIRNLISKRDKKTISYIDTIINNKLKDNDKVMFEVSKIPNGGLRGLLYSKILLMKELDINYKLAISKDIKTVDLINEFEDSTMLDICKVIGVYVDNSIQAVKDLNERFINLEMYLENDKLVISVSNNYEGKINEYKLENLGYTTKDGNHGYGLTLAREIINKNSNLINERSISKEIFTQILKIKM